MKQVRKDIQLCNTASIPIENYSRANEHVNFGKKDLELIASFAINNFDRNKETMGVHLVTEKDAPIVLAVLQARYDGLTDDKASGFKVGEKEVSAEHRRLAFEAIYPVEKGKVVADIQYITDWGFNRTRCMVEANALLLAQGKKPSVTTIIDALVTDKWPSEKDRMMAIIGENGMSKVGRKDLSKVDELTAIKNLYDAGVKASEARERIMTTFKVQRYWPILQLDSKCPKLDIVKTMLNDAKSDYAVNIKSLEAKTLRNLVKNGNEQTIDEYLRDPKKNATNAPKMTSNADLKVVVERTKSEFIKGIINAVLENDIARVNVYNDHAVEIDNAIDAIMEGKTLAFTENDAPSSTKETKKKTDK